MAQESRLMAHTSRLVAQGSSAPNFSGHEPRALSHEPWGMSHEHWASRPAKPKPLIWKKFLNHWSTPEGPIYIYIYICSYRFCSGEWWVSFSKCWKVSLLGGQCLPEPCASDRHASYHQRSPNPRFEKKLEPLTPDGPTYVLIDFALVARGLHVQKVGWRMIAGAMRFQPPCILPPAKPNASFRITFWTIN